MGCRMFDLVVKGVVDRCSVTAAWFDPVVSNCLDGCSQNGLRVLEQISSIFCYRKSDVDASIIPVLSASFVFYGDNIAHAEDVAAALAGLDIGRMWIRDTFELQGINDISVFYYVKMDQTVVQSLGPLSNFPTDSRTLNPTVAPTYSPSRHPTNSPTYSPTIIPTVSPTSEPTLNMTGAESFDENTFLEALANATDSDANASEIRKMSLKLKLQLSGITALDNYTQVLLTTAVSESTRVSISDIEITGVSVNSRMTFKGRRRHLEESLSVVMTIVVTKKKKYFFGGSS